MTKTPLTLPVVEPPAGWIVENHEDHISMFTPGRDAELRLTTFDVEETRTPAEKWVEVAGQINRRMGRPVVATTLGPFVGYATEFEAMAKRFRGWVLHCGGLPLDVTYTCSTSLRTRDDAAVDAALETLRIGGTAV